MELFFYIFLVFFFLLLEGFFSGSEIAVISASRILLKTDADNRNPGAILTEQAYENPENIFSTTSFGTNLSVVASSAILTGIFVDVYGLTEYGDAVAACILIPLTLLFGEIIPKVYFQQTANKSILFLIYPLTFFSKVFSPFIKVVTFVIRPILTFLAPEEQKNSYTRDDLRTALMPGKEEESSIEEEEREMIHNIISLHDTRVREIMVPLVNMVALNVQTTDVNTVLNVGKNSNFSRIPVYKDKFYNIVGIVNRLELINEKELSLAIEKYVKPVYYIPECKRIDELLSEMKAGGIHTAIAVDEHGGTTGLITVEDILEEIVGEIEDEHDVQNAPFYEANEDGSYIVEGSVEVHILNRELGINIPEDEGEYETLSGFLLEHLQKIPDRDEIIVIDEITYDIFDSDATKIYRVKIIIPIKEEEQEEDKPLEMT